MALLHLARRHRCLELFAAPPLQQIAQLGACRDVSIPDPVREPGPGLNLSVSIRDRIGQSVAVRLHSVRNRLLEGREALRGQVVLGNRTAPCDVTSISWSDLGKEETSTGRVDPICADKGITRFGAPVRPQARCKGSECRQGRKAYQWSNDLPSFSRDGPPQVSRYF